MELLFDENLSHKLVALVEDLFPDSIHSTGAGIRRGASDRQIWEYARQNDFVIVTADNDFMDLSEQFGHPPKIILLDNCDYPTRTAAHILRTQAATITESGPDERHILILRP